MQEYLEIGDDNIGVKVYAKGHHAVLSRNYKDGLTIGEHGDDVILYRIDSRTFIIFDERDCAVYFREKVYRSHPRRQNKDKPAYWVEGEPTARLQEAIDLYVYESEEE